MTSQARSGRASAETFRNVERSAGRLGTAAYRHMDAHLPWYRDLSAQERSWVGGVAQAGFASFVAWYVDPDAGVAATGDLFATAPRALLRALTLRQTLDLVRTVCDVVEDHIPELAAPGEEEALRVAVLEYSREVAFAAAQVYAGAAESRGAWDARLESLVVDAVVRGEAEGPEADDDALTSRAAALGWDDVTPVAVVVGETPPGRQAPPLPKIRTAAERLGIETLLAVQGRRLVVVLGGASDAASAASALAHLFGPGPVVVGPSVPRLADAGRSARAALSGVRAAAGWPDAPRPTLSVDLLPERVLTGDEAARAHLVDHVYRPLLAAGGSLAETCTTYLARGRALEATARALYVHANTVRYRLGRIGEVTGYDLTDAREAYVVQVAVSVGRLDGDGPARSQTSPTPL